MNRLEILNKLLYENVFYEPKYTDYRQRVYKSEQKQTSVLHLNEIIELIKRSDKFSLYEESISSINDSVLFNSYIHGIFHNERVSIFAFAIGILENLNDLDLKIVLEASKYHDIGRIDDSVDDKHGKRSSDKIDELVDLKGEDLSILKVVCHCHSIDDRDFDNVIKEYGIKDINRCKKLINVFKDSDGLDRVRIRYNTLDSSYLRTKSAKTMIPAAYELFYNYDVIYQTIELNDGPKRV